jgi:acyl carrier protein
MDAIPTTTTGKVDRRLLASLPIASSHGTERPAMTMHEQTVIDVWKTVLGVDGITPADDFFEIGGDSLFVITVVAALREMGFDVSSKDVFQRSTVADLAEFLAGCGRLAARSEPARQPANAGHRESPRPLAADFPAARLSQDELDRLLAQVSRETRP